MRNFWTIVNNVLKDATIILLILDARFPEQTMNKELQEKTGAKKLIYVLNKADLAERKTLEQWKRKHPNSVYISAKEHKGTRILLQKILEAAQGKRATVAVVGYPNTGKSSIINALKGRKSAGTSSHAGFTKAQQKIKITNMIYLIDTPGVLPYHENDKEKLSMIGATDLTKIKDPDLAALKLIRNKKSLLCTFYAVQQASPEKILYQIAIKYNKLQKEGKADINTTARMILRDWQKGKINLLHQ